MKELQPTVAYRLPFEMPVRINRSISHISTTIERIWNLIGQYSWTRPSDWLNYELVHRISAGKDVLVVPNIWCTQLKLHRLAL